MIGQVVDGHEFLRPLGVGGLGEMYLTRTADGSMRTLQLVRTDRAPSPEAVARIRDDVATLRTLRHPGIVPIVDAGQLPTGELYLAMEYVAGPDLQSMIGWDGAFSAFDAVCILAQLAAALAYAHAAGVIHRELKPANVVLVDGEAARARIIDFGLAKVVADAHLTRQADDPDRLGAPRYAAPEHSTEEPIGPPADVYALGGIAFFLLTGQPLFGNRPAAAMAQAHVYEPAPLLGARCKDVDLPVGLEALIGQCVAKAPAERPAAIELVLALDQMLTLTTSAPRARPAQQLFTTAGLTNLEEAVTSQLRNVLLDLAAVVERPTDDVDRIQHELSELEIDLAMIDSELEATPDPDLEARRATLAATVMALQRAVDDGFRELFAAVTADRGHAPSEAEKLYLELDALLAKLHPA